MMYWVLDMQKRFDTWKESLEIYEEKLSVSNIFLWCQNISKCIKLLFLEHGFLQHGLLRFRTQQLTNQTDEL